MATIRRSIYIGIGGAGVKAIAYTKKMFEETFGVENIPQGIQFLAIDSDPSVLDDLATDMTSDFIPIGKYPFVRRAYHMCKDRGQCDWMPLENEEYIPDLAYEGARQVRTNGRLFLELDLEKVKSRMEQLSGRVMNYLERNRDGYIQLDGGFDVHIACSLAGGTGSGAFIPLACLIRSMYGDRVSLFGYGLLPEVYKALDCSNACTPKINANAYAAVMELDYFQSVSPDAPATITVGENCISLRSPLFDRYCLLDNRTERGWLTSDLNSLCRMMADAMYMHGAEMGDPCDAMFMPADWRWGQYDIEDKRGWAGRFGICEVVYDGQWMAERYALAAKQELIRQLMYKETGMVQEAIDWARDAGVYDNGKNILIDCIFSPARISGLPSLGLSTADSAQEVREAIDRYINENHIDDNYTSGLQRHLSDFLRHKVDGILHGPKSLSDADSFLVYLKSVFRELIEGTEYSIRDYRDHSVHAHEVLRKLSVEYANYLSRFFKTIAGKQQYINDIILEARNVLVTDVELRRREVSVAVLRNLHDVVESLQQDISRIKHTVYTLEAHCHEERQKMFGCQSKSPIFRIDLAVRDSGTLTVSSDEVSLADFAASLPSPVAEMTLSKMDEAMNAYCHSLPRYGKYWSTPLSDVISRMSDEECNYIRAKIEEKTSPYLALNDRGVVNSHCTPPSARVRSVYAVAADASNNGGQAFLRCLPPVMSPSPHAVLIPSDSFAMRQKMIVYRIDSAFIPYCIDALNEQVFCEYEALIEGRQYVSRYNPHIDRHVYEHMIRTDFKLMPECFELAMTYWVLGQFLGDLEVQGNDGSKSIRYSEGMHWFWEPCGDGGGKWTPLAAERAAAFDLFRKRLQRYYPHVRGALRMLVARLGWCRVEDQLSSIVARGKRGYIEMVMGADSASGPNVEFLDKEWAFIEKKARDFRYII